ncbi:unnamed protein product [Cylindrotheca closterium]|uniref:Uncharacterized protein n=1 Tax=Cylindrotheca closterium TaxID=2856 RepID=A0AAD2G757_9STRA|nr:unnamed protein product [Cylindrotheca closterium]
MKKNEVGATLEDVRKALLSKDFGSAGDIWSGGETELLPVAPGLCVAGVGKIPLPLTTTTVDELKSVCLPITGGIRANKMEGAKNAVREVNADQVTLENPLWDNAMHQLTRKVASDLGANASFVSARLEKLVLYEPGDCTHQNQHSELEAGSFASLMVQLPSDYVGGSILVSHNGREKEFTMDSTNQAPNQCHFVAHYSDCDKEVLRIESGYRLALIYSLRYSGKETSEPSAKDIKEGVFISLLRKLRKPESLFAVPLDQKYDNSSFERLATGALQGSDRALSDRILRVDGWETAICKLERIGTYHGEDGDRCFEWDQYGAEYETSLKEIIDDDEAYYSYHDLFVEQLKLDSVGEDWAILATDDGIDKIWEEVDSTELEYTSRTEASMETTYHAYVLVAFSLNNLFEQVCRHDLDNAIELIEDDPCLLDRALAYLEGEKPTLSQRHLLPFHELVQRNHSENGRYWPDIDVMFRRLDTSAIPPDEVVEFISSLVKSPGRCDKTNAIYDYVDSLCSIAKHSDSLKLWKLKRSLVWEHRQVPQPDGQPAPKRIRPASEVIVIE